MAYLAKLAKRISSSRLVAGAIVLAAGACGQAETKDFLNPNPNQIVPVVASLRIEPQLGIVPANQEIQFTATGLSATGNVVPVTIVWSAPTGGTITTDGRFMADHSGQFQVSAYVTTNPGVEGSARAAIWERPTDVLEVFVSPDSSVVAPNEPIKLDAITRLANGTTEQTDALAWAANGGQVSGTGLFQASRVGDYVVNASAVNGATGSTRILVRDKSRSISTFSVAPGAVTVATGASQQFVASATFSDSTTGTVTGGSWSSTGGTISRSGLFTAGSVGGIFLVVGRDKSGVFADTAVVTVQAPSAVAVVVSPGSPSLAPGASQHFAAQATLSDGTTRATSVNWQATGGTINLNGDYTAGSTLGSYQVIGAIPGTTLVDTAEVTIAQPAATLTQVILNPSSSTLAAGSSQQYAVSAIWSDGSSTAPAVTWSATGGTVSIGGLYTAGAVAGTYRVIARAGNGVADTSAVTIAAKVLTSLTVTPGNVSVVQGATQQFTQSGVWSDGSTTAPTVTWTSQSGTISAAGLYTANGDVGTFLVIAKQQGGTLADSSLVTVSAPAASLTSLLLSPASATVAVGGGRQFAVSGTWSNGSTQTPPVSWNATGGTVSSSGLYAAGPVSGTYRVIANYSNTLADTSAVTVTTAAPTLSSVVLTPASASLVATGSQQFAVSGTWSDGSTGTPAVTWTATGGTVTNAGLYVAGATAGTFRVIATQVGGTKSDTASVTIGSATLTSVTTTPATVTLVPGASAAFTAAGLYSTGNTGSVAVIWSATGGTITSAGVYTAGLTNGTFRVIAVQQGGTLADTSGVTISGTAPTLSAVLLSPGSVAMFTGGQQQFNALAQYSNGTTGPLAVTWSATGGTVSSTGLYAAGTGTGTFRVIGADPVSGKADTSVVTIAQAPPPGQYQTLARQDWSAYADKTPLLPLFGVEGNNNLNYTPVLSAAAFWDLVPDPIFGKVIRYNGGPQLNPDSANAPGRVATYQIDLGGVTTPPNATWWTPPAGFPYANGKYYPTDVWVRQFYRTSTNWTNLSLTGGQGTADYKTMFLRYWNSAARHEVHFGIQERGLWHTGGITAGNLLGFTQTGGGALSINNTQTMDKTYNISGWPYVDLFPFIRASGPLSSAFLTAPWGPGLGEWIEIIVHHKTVAERGEFSLYWREYTVGGVVNPQPWQIDAKFVVGSPGQTFRGISNYQMGVNRNRQYDEVMYHYWGPFEVVDGSQFPNPWNLPGG